MNHTKTLKSIVETCAKNLPHQSCRSVENNPLFSFYFTLDSQKAILMKDYSLRTKYFVVIR